MGLGGLLELIGLNTWQGAHGPLPATSVIAPYAINNERTRSTMFTAHPLIEAMHAVHGIPPVSNLAQELLNDSATATATDSKPSLFVRWRAYRMRHAHPRPQRTRIAATS